MPKRVKNKPFITRSDADPKKIGSKAAKSNQITEKMSKEKSHLTLLQGISDVVIQSIEADRGKNNSRRERTPVQWNKNAVELLLKEYGLTETNENISSLTENLKKVAASQDEMQKALLSITGNSKESSSTESSSDSSVLTNSIVLKLMKMVELDELNREQQLLENKELNKQVAKVNRTVSGNSTKLATVKAANKAIQKALKLDTKNIVKGLKKIFSDLNSAIDDVNDNVTLTRFLMLGSMFSSLEGIILAPIRIMFEWCVLKPLAGLWSLITGGFSKLTGYLSDSFNDVWKGVWGMLGKFLMTPPGMFILGMIWGYFKYVIYDPYIKPVVDWLLGKGMEYGTRIFNWIVNEGKKIYDLWDKNKGFFDNVLTSLKTIVCDIWDAFQPYWEKIINYPIGYGLTLKKLWYMLAAYLIYKGITKVVLFGKNVMKFGKWCKGAFGKTVKWMKDFKNARWFPRKKLASDISKSLAKTQKSIPADVMKQLRSRFADIANKRRGMKNLAVGSKKWTRALKLINDVYKKIHSLNAELRNAQKSATAIKNTQNTIKVAQQSAKAAALTARTARNAGMLARFAPKTANTLRAAKVAGKRAVSKMVGGAGNLAKVGRIGGGLASAGFGVFDIADGISDISNGDTGYGSAKVGFGALGVAAGAMMMSGVGAPIGVVLGAIAGIGSFATSWMLESAQREKEAEKSIKSSLEGIENTVAYIDKLTSEYSEGFLKGNSIFDLDEKKKEMEEYDKEIKEIEKYIDDEFNHEWFGYLTDALEKDKAAKEKRLEELKKYKQKVLAETGGVLFSGIGNDDAGKTILTRKLRAILAEKNKIELDDILPIYKDLELMLEVRNAKGIPTYDKESMEIKEAMDGIKAQLDVMADRQQETTQAATVAAAGATVAARNTAQPVRQSPVTDTNTIGYGHQPSFI